MSETLPDTTPSLVVGTDLALDFTTTFTLSYNDKGSRGSHNGAFYQPNTPDGFHSLGSLGVNFYDNPDNKRAILIAKDISEAGDALAAPLDYRLIWNDTGSGADMDGSMWWPQAPNGYVAMGVVCNAGHGKPSVDIVRCVKKELVVPGTPGDLIWDDSKTGAKSDFGSWQVTAPLASSGYVTLAPGTFCGAPSHDQQAVRTGISTLYAFSIALPEKLPTVELPYPVLTSTLPPPPYGSDTSVIETEIPWFAVNDPAYSPIQQLALSPTYRMKRTDRFTLVKDGFYYNSGDNTQAAQVTYTEGVRGDSGTSFTSTTGIEIDSSYSFIGLFKGTIKLKQSFAHTSTSSSGWSKSTEHTVKFDVLPHTALAGYILDSTYDVYRQDGSQVNDESADYSVASSFYWAQYSARTSDKPS